MGTLPKNGHDQAQDRSIRDLHDDFKAHIEEEAEHHRNVDARIDAMDTANSEAHGEIMSTLKMFMNERSWGKWVLAFIISGIAWFMVLTLQHIWSGERWGKEMRHDIDQNHEAIERLQED